MDERLKAFAPQGDIDDAHDAAEALAGYIDEHLRERMAGFTGKGATLLEVLEAVEGQLFKLDPVADYGADQIEAAAAVVGDDPDRITDALELYDGLAETFGGDPLTVLRAKFFRAGLCGYRAPIYDIARVLDTLDWPTP